MFRAMAFVSLVVFVVGCGGGDASRPAPAVQPVVNAPPPPPPVPTPGKAPEQKPPETVQVKAERGVGVKGHYDETGMVRVITTPVASLFAARERMAFDVSIPQALNLFKAQEGRPPKSNEEFMERIIKENNIALPKLPEKHRYIYDPKTEQLMVEKPANE
jgi:hypothetical protein